MESTRVLIECLKSGNLKINPELKQLEIADGQLIFPYDKIAPSDWGYVYEKYVGQILETEGFQITYNGFKGYKDQGIDLIAEKGNCVTYIQCKYSEAKKLSKSHIDHILYKASKKLLETFKNGEKKLAFALIVHNKRNNFRRAPLAGDFNKIEYPWLEYFLNYNKTQCKVKVGFKEIPMEVNKQL